MFEYWTTNENLEIRFDIEHTTNNIRYLNIRIYNSKHRVTLPLKNRSKGFLWFFSFLVWFSKIQGDKNSNYILLLDEPGLSLHASAQNDLLRFIDEKLAPEYQVIYTTHSPFMIDSLKLNEVRTRCRIFLYSSQSAVPCATAAYICYKPLYGIHCAGMLPELKENPSCPAPPFPFAGLLFRDNGNIPNGIPLQFRTWLLHSIDYRFFAWYHK